jgi:hypothetical protein
MAAATPTDPIMEKTVCLALRRGKFGHRRDADKTAMTVDSDKALLGLRKTILVSPELSAVAAVDREIDTYLKIRCLAAPFVRGGGIQLLPLALVEAVDAQLTTDAARRQDLVDAAVDALPIRWAETQERLKVLTSLEQPSADRFRATFYMEWKYFQWDTPGTLQTISASIYAAERQKAAASLAAVLSDCEQAMRVGLQELLDKMVVSLKPGLDGKPKRFYATTVTNFQAFLDTFDARNVTNDDALAALAARAKAILRGVDPAVVAKTDVAGRQSLAAGFQAIQAALVPLAGARRHFAFEDEAVA